MQVFAHESAQQYICPFFNKQRASEGSFTHFFEGSQEEQTSIDCFGTHFRVNGSFLICAQIPLKQVGSEPSVVQVSPAFFMQIELEICQVVYQVVYQYTVQIMIIFLTSCTLETFLTYFLFLTRITSLSVFQHLLVGFTVKPRMTCNMQYKLYIIILITVIGSAFLLLDCVLNNLVLYISHFLETAQTSLRLSKAKQRLSHASVSIFETGSTRNLVLYLYPRSVRSYVPVKQLKSVLQDSV
ncbi:Hypothetical_protein [Hexamita inflata]|uniref:Hypothetical_protein n=1 Tax=Hexamita inflata TaxID=28002 RepID=A0AA86S1D7_9EUKA|nr:Hypothetical protein HINF_LOCUS63970 [Hexamita inflata]